MTAQPRVAVIGAGIVGLATAYSLVERGHAVTVYERGAPGNGQSGGDSRVFRHAHDDPRLVTMAQQSRSIWREWEQRLGLELVSTDGVVALGPTAERRLQVLEEMGDVSVRPIDEAEVHERLPLLAGYSGVATFDESGGSIRTRAAVETLADRLDGSLVGDEVLSLRPLPGGGVEVRAGGSCEHYDRVVVAAGQATAQLARGVGLALPVTLAAQVRCTFAVRDDPPDRLACLQDSSGHFGDSGIYAAPLAGNHRYALGLSETVEVHDDGSLVDPSALAELSERASAYVSRALPGLGPEPVEYRHCWVTEVPWSADGFAVWEVDGIYFVAGHNLFKQAPAVGRALARAALDGCLSVELRPEATLGQPA